MQFKIRQLYVLKLTGFEAPTIATENVLDLLKSMWTYQQQPRRQGFQQERLQKSSLVFDSSVKSENLKKKIVFLLED